MFQDTYEIKIEKFEGPFDLLLFFIERDELSIDDIPIAKLTKDFLDYIQEMQRLNIELASEFILVAATLMRIKAKMLIPRKELDELGNPIDPRQELADRLLEYKKYKAASEALIRLEEQRYKMHKRGNIAAEVELISEAFSGEMELQSLTMYRLMRAFEQVMERKKYSDVKVVHRIVQYDYSIETQREYVLSLFWDKESVSFIEIFDVVVNRVQAIFTFLAMLELIQMQTLGLTPGLGMNNFWVYKTDAVAVPQEVDLALLN
jgi:segregation and condensation protein A